MKRTWRGDGLEGRITGSYGRRRRRSRDDPLICISLLFSLLLLSGCLGGSYPEFCTQRTDEVEDLFTFARGCGEAPWCFLCTLSFM